MTMVVALFLALAGMVFFYAIGQGGPVAALVFLLIVFIGAVLKVTEPLRHQLKP